MATPFLGRGETILIQDRLHCEFDAGHPMHEMARYHLQSGGKCLRGQLALAEAQASEWDAEQALTWALACELLHNATLIHDDIQDNDPIRRGRASVWKKFGTAQAINTGDLLIFRSFKLTAKLNSPALIELLSETAETLVRGQVDELVQIHGDEQGYWNSYLKMTELKTGTLFKLPVHGIQILRDQEMSNLETQAWYSMGACYQIYDDIRDFFGLKQQGQQQKDFEEQRINALVAWMSRDPQFNSLIREYLEVPKGTKERQALIQNLATTIQSSNIVGDLVNFAMTLLKEFRTHTKSETQKVVLNYFESAVQKGVIQHGNIQI